MIKKERMVKKEKKSFLMVLLDFSPIIGAVLGLLIGSLFVMLWGVSPVTFFKELFKGAFGSTLAIGSDAQPCYAPFDHRRRHSHCVPGRSQ